MAERLKKTKAKFTLVSNSVLTDARLSLKAKGIYAYLYSKPDDWVFHLEVMKAELKESRDAIHAAINELIAGGYVRRYQQNDGKFGGTVYEFKDPNESQAENPCTENPCTENPCTENPCTENPHTTNTNSTNTDSTKIEYVERKKKKENLPNLSFLDTSPLKEVFLDYMEYRRSIQKPLKTQKGIESSFKTLNDYSDGDIDRARAIVEQSEEKEWVGLFPLKSENGVKKPSVMDQVAEVWDF